MRRTSLAGVVVFAAVCAEGAQTLAPGGKAPAMRVSFIGEGGASPAPIGAELSGAFEEAARQQGRRGNYGRQRVPEPPKADNPRAPSTAAPQPPRDTAVSAKPPASRLPEKGRESDKEEGDRRRYSLWSDLEAPLELPENKISEMSVDQAMTLGRQDYDAHILGQKKSQVPAGDSTDLAAALVAVSPAGGESAKKGEIFVSFDLDLKSNPNQYRDALAGLKFTAQFQPDARFAPRFEGLSGQRASVSGWMSADKISAAMQVPSVLRMQVERGAARPGVSNGTLSQMLVGIRIPKRALGDQASGARQNLTRVVRELSADAGFVWKKTIGYQAVPGSQDVALVVAGEVAIKNISRVMSHPDVIKMVPSPGLGRPAEARPAARPMTPARRFFSYAVDRSPWLILLTLVVLVPSVGSGLVRLAKIFIPYG